jgi:riboflavin kinase / FMN adenylyltransferase
LIVHHDLNNIKIEKPVATIGIFDGVHTGHKLILEKLKAAARRITGQSVVITLWPHPRTILKPEIHDLKLLNTLEEKQKYMEESGIDHLIILPFTLEFSHLSSCDFIKEYLIDRIGVRHLVVGFNHHFGRDREGDIQKIRECAENYHFNLEKLNAHSVNGIEVSSSKIREKLENGELREANAWLGYTYSLTGIVVGGSQLGRKIGFPTANIKPLGKYKSIPADGVYAVKVDLGDIVYNGILNIGYRPTVSENKDEKSIEVHILNYEGVLYNEEITVYFHERLREEMRFEGIEELRKQLEKDRSNALIVLDKI